MHQLKILLFLSCALTSFQVLGKTTSSTSSGSFIAGANWDNGAPVDGDSINVNHLMYLDALLDVFGSLVIQSGGELIDTVGGTSYPLEVSNTGKLILNGGDLTLEDTLLLRNTGAITIGACDTLSFGGGLFDNSSTVSIASCAVLISNGNLTMANSNGVASDGFIRVNGNISLSGSSAITGAGNFSTSGTITYAGTASIYGNTSNCTPGPCSLGTGFPLPLELLNFGIVKGEKGHHFTWTYLQDEHITGYWLQRSAELKMWINIFETESNETLGSVDYQCSDPMPMEGTSYYRLKILSDETQASYSQVVEIGSTQAMKPSLLYPNPFSDILHIPCTQCSYQLFDMSSKKLTEFKGGAVDLSHLQAGIYFLRSMNGVQRINKL